MTDEKTETLIALISGLELAVVHLCNVLDQKGVASKSELAMSFVATAEGIPEHVKHRQAVALPLHHIAAGLMNKPGGDGMEQVRNLFR